MFKPCRSLRFTHQVKFSSSLWKMRSIRSPGPPFCLRSFSNTRMAAQACTGG